MDRSVLPDIFSLAVFIAGFRPLARRMGAQANVWFLGWGFLLLHYMATLYASLHGGVGVAARLVAALAVDLCALSFVMAAANVPTRRIGYRLLAAISAPVLLLSLVARFPGAGPWPALVACALFLGPGIYVLTQPRQRCGPMIVLSTAYAVFGLAMVPVVLHHAQHAAYGSLSLLFLCAAYLYFVSAERHTRGVIAAVVGLAGWGLSYLVTMGLNEFFPGFPLDRALVQLPRYLVVAGIMLTLLEEYVERTERMAMHDPLTDLPNRRLFEQRLIATMEEARINRTTVACLVIDVDNFKTINDTLGHEAGDQLLRALAVRLSWHMSPRDILARTGGDEFTALLAGVTDEHHLRFIAGAMMSAGSVPIMIDGKPVDMHISIGIALSPDHADDIDSLRRAADEAMYIAKRKGGAMLAFADED